MAFLSLNSYDTPGLAPRMNVLFWGPGDFPVSCSNRDILWNTWNRHSGSFMVDTGVLFSNTGNAVMKSHSHECLMTFWPLTNSDFPTEQTFHQFHDLETELDLHRIMSGFHGAFVTGVACQQGTLTLPDTWFRPLFETCLCSNCRDLIPQTWLDFSPWIPIDTFLILLSSEPLSAKGY